MSIEQEKKDDFKFLFDPETGVIKQDIEELVKQRRKELEIAGVIFDEQTESFYNIILYNISTYYIALHKKFQDLFDSFAPSTNPNSFFAQAQDYTDIGCTTEKALIDSFRLIEGVEDANIVSSKGSFHTYLLVNPTQINESNQLKNNEFGKLIWNTFYYYSPAGTQYEGDIAIQYPNPEKQSREFKFSLAKRKYVYIKMKYKITSKNVSTPNIDERIRSIYKRVVANNYGAMGISFEHQDFVGPTNEIENIKLSVIQACVKDDTSTNITSIGEGDFTSNKDSIEAQITVQPDELLFFDLDTRLLIGIEQ